MAPFPQPLKKRTLLSLAGGLLSGTAIAGCIGDDDSETGDRDDGDDDSSDDGDDSVEEIEPEYRLELSEEHDIDLSNIESGYNRAAITYSTEAIVEAGLTTSLDLRLIEEVDGETTEYGDPDEIEEILGQALVLEIADESLEYRSDIPEYLLAGATSELVVRTEDNAFRAETTVRKVNLPEEVAVVPYFDGTPLYEQFPNHYPEIETELEFVKIDLDPEHYEELREKHVYEDTWHQIVEPTLENDEVDFNPELDPGQLGLPRYSHGGNNWKTEEFKQHTAENAEDIINDSGTAFILNYAENEGGAPSGQMNNKAATTMTLIDEHGIDIDLQGFYVGSRGDDVQHPPTADQQR